MLYVPPINPPLRDEPVDSLLTTLVDVGAEVVVEPLRVKDLPQQALYQGFEEAGERRGPKRRNRHTRVSASMS